MDIHCAEVEKAFLSIADPGYSVLSFQPKIGKLNLCIFGEIHGKQLDNCFLRFRNDRSGDRQRQAES
jgi:hypothetical protein